MHLDRGIKVGDISNAIHVYPSYSVASMQAAAAVRVEKLLRGRSGQVILHPQVARLGAACHGLEGIDGVSHSDA